MLEISELEVGYGGPPVLKRVSLRLAGNETVGIIGANGAGKTTLVRAICGLLEPSFGRIVKDGIDVGALPPHRRVLLGIAAVLENRHLFGEMTIEQHLALAEAYGRKRSGMRLDLNRGDVLGLFPFMKGRLGSAAELLSGGEQQMVAIAKALLLQPDVLIMDEPSTGLAPLVVKEIVSVLATLKARGMSIILVEQNVALAAEASDRGYVMAVGEVVHEIGVGEWQAFLGDERLVQAYLGES